MKIKRFWIIIGVLALVVLGISVIVSSVKLLDGSGHAASSSPQSEAPAVEPTKNPLANYGTGQDGTFLFECPQLAGNFTTQQLAAGIHANAEGVLDEKSPLVWTLANTGVTGADVAPSKFFLKSDETASASDKYKAPKQSLLKFQNGKFDESCVFSNQAGQKITMRLSNINELVTAEKISLACPLLAPGSSRTEDNEFKKFPVSFPHQKEDDQGVIISVPTVDFTVLNGETVPENIQPVTLVVEGETSYGYARCTYQQGQGDADSVLISAVASLPPIPSSEGRSIYINNLFKSPEGEVTRLVFKNKSVPPASEVAPEPAVTMPAQDRASPQ